MSQHLKRIFAPSTWPIARKGYTYIAKPSRGPHTLATSMPLNVILTQILKVVKTTREVRKILQNKFVLVNHKVCNDSKFPVGIMDVLTFVPLKKNYRMLFSETGKFTFQEISEAQSKLLFKQITGKTLLKKGVLQLNFGDGTNLLVDKDDYKVGDSLIFSGGSLKKHLKLEKGCTIYLVGGTQTGKYGVLESVSKPAPHLPSLIHFTLGKETFSTIKEYAFVVEQQ